MSPTPETPVVLVIAGNDPSGGAGLCADVQAISAQHCHPAPVVTALTVQDTRNASRIENVEADLVIAQAKAVCDDMSVAAVKLGLLGSIDTALAVANLLADLPGIPVVIDPVLVATGGAALAESGMAEIYRESLAARATIMTPNVHEIVALGSPAGDRDQQVQALLERGCRHVLVTGGDADTTDVVNDLYEPGKPPVAYRWPRRAGRVHGSGCTLAAALAARFALGDSVHHAVTRAQEYTAHSIDLAWQPGKGARIPAR